MAWLENIFSFSEKSPFLFTSIYFWIFYLVVLGVYSIIHPRMALRNGFLFFASLFFYYKTSGFFFFILLFSTVVDYGIGWWLYSTRTSWKRKILLALSVVVNLSLLAYFKYAYFFTDSFNQITGSDLQVHNFLAGWANAATDSDFDVGKILLPVGISFFTFQTISYSTDIYRGILKPVKNILDFGFYVSFFPQLVAGPIVRASEFIPQLYKPFSLTRQEFGLAVFWILNGLLKKIFLADFIAGNFTDRVFSEPLFYSGFENIMALFGYSLQVYADFSGYTDIAIGVALLMGFRLSINFNSPYKAINVGEFWKRWHISLSTWLKDYLYIPMGGNRRATVFTYVGLVASLLFIVLLSGELWLLVVFTALSAVIMLLVAFIPSLRKHINTNINLMLTMLLGGLWHGASWQFVIWGGLNGVGLVIYKYWRKISPWEHATHLPARVWKITLTFLFITFTRIFFRSESMKIANDMMYQISHDTNYAIVGDILLAYKYIFITMIAGYIIHWLPESFKERYRGWFINAPVWLQALICCIVIFLVYQVLAAGLRPFIYFQF